MLSVNINSRHWTTTTTCKTNLYNLYKKKRHTASIKCKCKHSIFEDTAIDGVRSIQYVSLSEISDLIDVSKNMVYRDKVDLFLSYGIDYSKVIEYYDSVDRLEKSLHTHEDSYKIISGNQYTCFYLMVTIVMSLMRLLG